MIRRYLTNSYNIVLPSLIAGIIGITYISTHNFPAHIAGFYLDVSQQIANTNTIYPSRVSHYSFDGAPFAYPPLGYFLAAFVIWTGVLSPLTVALVLPTLCVVLYAAVLGSVSSSILRDRYFGTIAAIAATSIPFILKYQLVGWIRSLGFLFVIVTVYYGLRFYRDDLKQAGIWTAIFFGLTLLTHPVHALFAGLTVLSQYLAFDRTIRGFGNGVGIGFGGIILASPWLVVTILRHGFDPFFAAVQTHGGVGTGVWGLLGQPTLFSAITTVFVIVAAGASILLILEREYWWGLWFLVSVSLVTSLAYVYLTGIFAIIAVMQKKRQQVDELKPMWLEKRSAATVFLIAVSIGSLLAGGIYVTGQMSPTYESSLDTNDMSAMEWAETTPVGTTYLVVGQEAEWFPFIANRTTVVSPWGNEWDDDYDTQGKYYQTLLDCQNISCIDNMPRHDYVYITNDKQPTVGRSKADNRALVTSLRASSEYCIVHRSRNVIIFENECISN